MTDTLNQLALDAAMKKHTCTEHRPCRIAAAHLVQAYLDALPSEIPYDAQLFETVCNEMERGYRKTDDSAGFHDVGALRGYVHGFLNRYIKAQPVREMGTLEEENMLLRSMICHMQRNPEFDFTEALKAERNSIEDGA